MPDQQRRPGFSLQPVAGAHHAARDRLRNKVLVSASAHGTKPTSARPAGFEVVAITNSEDGLLHPEQAIPLMDHETAVIMLTNPNTFGLFKPYILEIAAATRQLDLSCTTTT